VFLPAEVVNEEGLMQKSCHDGAHEASVAQVGKPVQLKEKKKKKKSRQVTKET